MKLILIWFFSMQIVSVVGTYGRRHGTSSRNSVSFLLRKVCVEVTGLKEDVAGLNAEVAGLNAEVAGLNAEVAGLKEENTELKEEIDELNDRVFDTEQAAPTSAFSTYKGTISYVDGVVVWSEPTLNIGSHYNTTTGKYCAEHSGTYLFQLNLVKKSLLASVVCSLFKESDRIGDAWVPTETIWAGQFESSTTAIVHLVQGECVYVGGCNGFSNMADTTTFTGTLLFQDSD